MSDALFVTATSAIFNGDVSLVELLVVVTSLPSDGSPTMETLLVIDAMIGQEAVNVADCWLQYRK